MRDCSRNILNEKIIYLFDLASTLDYTSGASDLDAQQSWEPEKHLGETELLMAQAAEKIWSAREMLMTVRDRIDTD